MSTCPQCYTGTCKRHKRQDHGTSLIKSANAESTLQKMYDQLVGSKLQKLQEEAKKDVSSQITTAYRKKLDASRDKSMHKKRSKLSSEDYNGSGLNPQALAAINDRDSDVSDDERRQKKKKSGSKRRGRDMDDDSEVSDDSNHDFRRPKRSSSDRKHHRHSKSNHEKKRHKRSQSDSSE